MEKLITFNNKVNKLLGVNIHYNSTIENFKLNGTWVTDLNHWDFENFENSFIRLIETHINKDSEREVVFLKNIQVDLIKKHKFLNKIDYNNVDTFCSSMSMQYPKFLPTHNPEDLAEVTPWDEEGRADYVFNLILDHLGIDFDEDNEYSELDFLELNDLLKEKGLDTNKLYSIAHLKLIIFYQLVLFEKVIKEIQSYLDTLSKMGINYWEKEDEPRFPNPHQLHFNMLKKEVGLFFHTFHQMGLIHGDFEKRDISETEMKKFLNSGGFYYVNKSKQLKPLIKIDKEFDSVYRNGNHASKINETELNYLENMIKRLQERYDYMELEVKNYNEKSNEKSRY